MLNDLKRAVCKANRELQVLGAMKFANGSVSGFDPSMGLFVIKPSGVPYSELQPELMVVMSLDGQKVEGRLNPSSDMETHRALYLAWPMLVRGIAHTHSTYATAFAHAGKAIHAARAAHSDHPLGDVPVTRLLRPDEIEKDYGFNTGKAIAEAISDPEKSVAVLVREHGAYTWGKTCAEAATNAAVLEAAAEMDFIVRLINPGMAPG